MPELPEVETVCRGLRNTVVGKVLTAIKFNRESLRFPIVRTDFDQFYNRQITAVKRRSKYIIIEFNAVDAVIIIHLGMSGRLNYHPGLSEKPKHTHVEFTFIDHSQLCFVDPRRFGFIQVIGVQDLNHYWHTKNLGIEPLGESFDARYLYQSIKQRKVPLKSFLLDQRFIAGLGNIYVCEALHLANLSPIMQACDMTLDQCVHLVAAIKSVLVHAIAAGGSTLKDHTQVDGTIGNYQLNFKVYGQLNKTCQQCHHGMITCIKQNGRSTFLCLECQPNPVV